MKNQIKLFAVLLGVLTLVSCKDKNEYSKISDSNQAPKSDVHKIKIIESIDAGTYTYLNVDEEGNSYWMAVPNTRTNVGDTYYYEGGMVMKDFESEQLSRTFDKITFAEAIRSTEKAVESNKNNPHTKTEAKVEEEVVKIETPENGTALVDLFTNRESFSKKSIIVKGKVVKVNNGILDKNWVHIVDGTNFENKKSLTVTTTEKVAVGDIVTFKGIIILDKDFGQGYVYDILLEEGELLK